MHILGNNVASQKEFDDHSKKVISTLAAIEEDLEKTQSLLSRTNERVQDENEKLNKQYKYLLSLVTLSVVLSLVSMALHFI
jgi:hypothetical protein